MRRAHRWASVAALGAALALAGACGGPAAEAPTSGTARSSSSAAGPLTIPITIKGGQVTPNGEKMTAKVGQEVVLQVTSDEADEIHAHTGGDGYELEVPANQPTTGSFTPTSPGSFEIESHHLEKVVVVLNVS